MKFFMAIFAFQLTSEACASSTRAQQLLDSLTPMEMSQLQDDMQNFNDDAFLSDLKMMLSDPLVENMRILKKRGMRLL
ncbi:Oidioi.mRNA.OKI2018_I69.PAR.g9728.t1.cds [Oikopleura dioica]|uniref:Oidioi.mRNA.OKI2018_I69.PAR.g9728.t1.cds n=1 Tax=Oikopleura dioica TaxID=34765 RepID=A0ABN7RM21_OIKDI|nr:Oidioi.mRNA.OKI2018_I69.PAR.g9728.t1.cds [Oikopleura dioica]